MKPVCPVFACVRLLTLSASQMPRLEHVEGPPITGKKAHYWGTYKAEIGRNLAGAGFSSGLRWIVAESVVRFPVNEAWRPKL